MAIKIIGTSHISPESLKKVESIIREKNPQIVAVELDRRRLAALLSKEKARPRLKDIRRVGLKGWLFAMIGAWIEQKLGKKVGVAPGAEMLKAISTAQEVGSKIALIDQDIEVTLKRFSKSLTWKEKGRFVADIIKSLLFRKGITFNLAKVPSQQVIQKLLNEVRLRYPNVYRVLVTERNVYMAQSLARLAKRFPEAEILAVVGAGHEREIAGLLKRYLKQKQDITSELDN